MCGSEYNVQRQRGNTILRLWNDSKRMSFGHADRNMCGSAGISVCFNQVRYKHPHQNSTQGICIVGDFLILHFAGQKRFIILFFKNSIQ